MKSVVKFISEIKWVTIPIGISFLTYAMLLFVHSGTLERWTEYFNYLADGFQRYHLLLAMGNAMIIAGFHYVWGKKVEYEAKKYHLSAEKVKKYKRFRYVLIGFILLIDYITFCH